MRTSQGRTHTAISRTRLRLWIRSRLATLAQAISSTKPARRQQQPETGLHGAQNVLALAA